ncbi:MAG TPA: MarR family transcriptional regulator [Gaiellaceae bacterium]|nr:MarR family transcriptional regulator [Gaiellaceae bacterium]
MSGGQAGAETPLLPATLARRLGFMLLRAGAGMSRLGAETLAPLGIDGRQYGVLAALSELGPVSQQTLADTFAVDRSTMVGLVDELERRGHVRRGKNPADRRAYALELTRSGAALEREAAKLLEGCERHYLEPLSPEERNHLLALLERLVARDMADI